ncbi:Alpha/Beta hydrolase protein [Chytridium lagenaria]|nr:Alpha/Beta hydrolase protein [Chytridium lagenaria]
MVAEKEDYALPVKVLPYILSHDVPVFIYAGDHDYLLHHTSLEKSLDRMIWNGARGFFRDPSVQPMTPWYGNGSDVLGHVAHARGLTYVRVERAGHLVGMDQPMTMMALVRMVVESGGRGREVTVDAGWAERNWERWREGRRKRQEAGEGEAVVTATTSILTDGEGDKSGGGEEEVQREIAVRVAEVGEGLRKRDMR